MRSVAKLREELEARKGVLRDGARSIENVGLLERGNAMRMTVLIACLTFSFGSSALAQQVRRLPTTATPIVSNVTAPRTQNRPNLQGRPAEGVVEGFVYWDNSAIKHIPPNSCSGLSVTVSGGGAPLITTTDTFAYMANAGNNVVCRYGVKGLPVERSLQVQANITLSAFSPAVLLSAGSQTVTITAGFPACAPGGPVNPSPSDLSSGWSSCANIASNVNFVLVPAGGLTRPFGKRVPPSPGGSPIKLNQRPNNGALLLPKSQKVLLGSGSVGNGGSGAPNATKTADSLNPQPYPPKRTSTVNGGATAGSSAVQSQEAEQRMRAELAKAPVPGKVIRMTANGRAVSPNATILAALEKQRQAADKESSQMKLGIRSQGQSGMLGQQSQAMSANGGGSAAAIQPAGSASQSTTVAQAGNGSNSAGGRSGGSTGAISSLARLSYAQSSIIIACVKDPTMRIVSVSSSSYPATFTPTDKYNLYTIRGCSFGDQAPTSDQNPTDWVHLYGGTGSFYGKFAIRFWSDNEIDVSLDESISGFPDLDNLNLVVKRADGQQTQKGGFKFYAARETVPLITIPQTWVTLGAFPNTFNVQYSTPPPSPSWTLWGPGPGAGAAYVARYADGVKFDPSGESDYYDFSKLAPGFTTETFEADPYVPYCPSGNGMTVTYKTDFGTWSGSWDGNNIRIGLSETSCSGVVVAVPWVNYQNHSGSDYALKVWVTGPRGTDPFTGKPTH